MLVEKPIGLRHGAGLTSNLNDPQITQITQITYDLNLHRKAT
jgi:hypothetical protein